MFPVPAVSCRFSLPLTVELKVMLPAPLLVSMATAPVSVTAELYVTLSLDVVTSPAVWMPLAAVKETGPSAKISPLSVMLMVELLDCMVTVPSVRLPGPATGEVRIGWFTVIAPLAVTATAAPSVTPLSVVIPATVAMPEEVAMLPTVRSSASL